MVKKLIIFYLITRVILVVAPWLLRIIYLDGYTYQTFYNYLINSWSFWDAPHFLYIAQHWYTSVGDPANFIVFFPLYPIIVSFGMLAFQNPEISGITVSTICLGLTVPVFYKLVNLISGSKIAFRSVIYLLIFPTAFFFSAPYSESLYILLWSISLLSAFKNKWIVAGLSAGLACLTRNFGILILPALIIEWLKSKDKNWFDLFLIIVPSILAISIYLFINYAIYDDYFAFTKIMHDHWQKSFSNPILTFVNIWKSALLNPIDNYSFSIYWIEGISLLFILILTILGFKKIPLSLFVYQILSLILVSSTSFVLSTPRYILSIPTVFIILAIIIKNPSIRKVYEFVSIGLLFLLTYFYTLGKWVA